MRLNTPQTSACHATILIVDDVAENRELLKRTLEPMNCEILLTFTGEQGIKAASRGKPDLILLDVLMPGINGYEVCRRLKENESTRHIPVIFITAQNDIPSLLEGFQAGGVDFITKPFRMEEVQARVETHLTLCWLTRALQEKNVALEAEIRRRESAEESLATADERLSLLTHQEATRWGVAGMLGQTGGFSKLIEDIRKAQNAGSLGVLVTGENGTGKELIARAIHYGGSRSKGPFIPINCAAIPKDLAESFFFGHRRGAFSGAHSDQKGCFELAQGGTLFLDEVGEMPSPLQAKLLRVLEDGCIAPLGAAGEKQCDVRVVAASNVDFSKRIASGDFRQDLFFRLARFTIHAPPLRERREDIPLLAAHFATMFAAEMGKPVPKISDSASEALKRHPYPGNVRELKHLIEEALIESGGLEIQLEHLRFINLGSPTSALASKPADFVSSPGFLEELPLNLEDAERALIRRALSLTGGNVSKAAELLGINRARIYRALAGDAQSNSNPSGPPVP